MCVIYEHNGEEVWNPSNGVSKVFMKQVSAFEDLLGAPSGLGPGNSDEVDIDLASLGPFLELLEERLAAKHRVLASLLRPSAAILCCLFVRSSPDESTWPIMSEDLLAEGRELLR